MSSNLEKAKEIFDIFIPEVYKDRLIFLFKDEDSSNFNSSNVTYTFMNGPLECPFYPNYYYIPKFSRYVINKDGDVITVKTGIRKKWTRTIPAKDSIRGGYVTMNLVNDAGIRRALVRHRAIALTFKEYDKHPDNFVVNHINGVGGDDRIENVEFCTYSENTKHAYDLGLYSNKLVSIDAMNWITGESLDFPSIQAAANYLKKINVSLTVNGVESRLRYHNGKKYLDGWRFKRKSEDWLPLNERVGQTTLDREVLAKNIFTNEEYVFGSIKLASDKSGVNKGSITSYCNKKFKTPIYGWLFRFKEDFCGWPKFTDKQLFVCKENLKKVPKGIEVYDIETNKTMLFSRADKAAEYFNLDLTSVYKYARCQITYRERYKFDCILINLLF